MRGFFNKVAEHIDKLHALAQYLMEHEKIDGENFVRLMDE